VEGMRRMCIKTASPNLPTSCRGGLSKEGLTRPSIVSVFVNSDSVSQLIKENLLKCLITSVEKYFKGLASQS